MIATQPTDLNHWKTQQIKKELNQCLFKAGYMPHPIIYKKVYVIKDKESSEEQYYLRESENENGQFLLKACFVQDDMDQPLLSFETFDNRNEEYKYSPSFIMYPQVEYAPLQNGIN